MNCGTLWLISKEIKTIYQELAMISNDGEEESDAYNNTIIRLKKAIKDESSTYNKDIEPKLAINTNKKFYDIYFYSFFFKVIEALDKKKIISGRVLYKFIDKYYVPNIKDYNKLAIGLTIPKNITKKEVIDKIVEKKEILKELDFKLTKIFLLNLETNINNKNLSSIKKQLIEFKYNMIFLDNESEISLINKNYSKKERNKFKSYSAVERKKIETEYINRILLITANELLNMTDKSYESKVSQEKSIILDSLIKTAMILSDDQEIDLFKEKINNIISTDFYKKRQGNDKTSKSIIFHDIESAKEIKDDYNNMIRKRK